MKASEIPKGTMLKSTSLTISKKEQDRLIDMTNRMSKMLTPQEFFSIVLIYNECVNRIYKENGIDIG